jgi:hypothetical protein
MIYLTEEFYDKSDTSTLMRCEFLSGFLIPLYKSKVMAGSLGQATIKKSIMGKKVLDLTNKEASIGFHCLDDTATGTAG